MDMSKLTASLKAPYPEVTDVKPNPHFARLLAGDVSGYSSEITGIMQYLYQTFIVKQYEEEIYDILNKIACVEMHHMDILSELIVQLGGSPVYNGGGSQFWNAGFINYTNNLLGMMNANIAAERQAIANYKMRIRQTNESQVQQLLARIIADEELHLEIFEEIRSWASDRSKIKLN